MDSTLKKAFDKISDLPEKERDNFAEFILNELESETKWNSLFENSKSELSSLAQEAIEEYKTGETKDLNFNKS